MTLRIYNTLTKTKEPFSPIQEGKVGMYLCGPTVYKPPHVGHMVGPVIFDAIKRYLVHKGYQVTWVVNITDVDDKLIAEANATGQTMQQVAERCTRQYLDCLDLLGIDTIDRYPKASEHIAEIIGMIRTLIEKGHAYPADGNVWFDVATDPDYGKLSHRSVEEQQAGTRDTEGAGKKNPADFALWKAAKKDEPTWDSPWGPGRPGWHIECSAMSTKYLGETFDIHGGGMDLLFPHHENELAQSESATGKPFVRYWLHNGLTRIRTKAASGEWKMEKQSKSLGNVIDARTFIEENGAELVRYLLLSTHYRRPIDFSEEVLIAARKGLQVFARLFERVERLSGRRLDGGMTDIEQAAPPSGHESVLPSLKSLRQKFFDMMDDDFNTAGGIAVLHELAGEVNAFIERSGVETSKDGTALYFAAAGAGMIRQLGRAIGLFRFPLKPAVKGNQDELTEKLMQLLIQLRADARKSKNFALADAIRKGLTDAGVTLEDRPDGTVWRRA